MSDDEYSDAENEVSEEEVEEEEEELVEDDPQEQEVKEDPRSDKEDEDRKKRGGEEGGANFLKNRAQMKMSELDEQLAEYIAEWRKQRQKEEEELNKLKEKQARRKVLRAEEEKKLAEQKKAEEERKLREESDRKAKEQDEKRKRLEDAEKKRQGQQKAGSKWRHDKKPGEHAYDGVKKFGSKSGDKFSNIQAAKGEMGKTKEQLAEEKKIALSIRVKPIGDLETMDEAALKTKANEMWTAIVKLETEKYDYEERMKRQDYDLKELKERQTQRLRQKALKRGLDPEALTGKHPPKIQTASKFERRTDRRTYDDKKHLFNGEFLRLSDINREKKWSDRMGNYDIKLYKGRLPRWFGERPGRKPEDPPSDDELEEEADLEPPPPPEEEEDDDEEEEEIEEIEDDEEEVEEEEEEVEEEEEEDEEEEEEEEEE